jgi:dTDP-4-dehydrorhamnose 3,5-epimerase
MRLDATAIAGVFHVTTSRAVDERGAFLRAWCAEAFRASGIDFTPTQASLSENHRAHTLRGLHWQAAPHAEQKLVRCMRGAILDVAVDLRADSPTRFAHVACELSAANATALFIPRGCAHGFISLTDDATVAYLIDAPFEPASSRGARFDDPRLAIPWPAAPAVISARDLAWPPL